MVASIGCGGGVTPVLPVVPEITPASAAAAPPDLPPSAPRGLSVSPLSSDLVPLCNNMSRTWTWIQVRADNIAEQVEQPCFRKGGLRRQEWAGEGVRVGLRRQLQDVVSRSTAQLAAHTHTHIR